jgi:hypothetical protein
LQNPRYTGHQVWNRQRTDRDLADPADVSLGHRDVQRWNLPDGWVISNRPAYPALVSEADFIAAQDVSAARGPSSRTDLAGPQKRRYLLSGGGVRAADGIGVVQRQARLPAPSWPHHRRGTRSGSAEERARA